MRMSALERCVSRIYVPLCALTASGTIGRVLAKREERIIFALAKEEEHRFFLFSHL